MVLFNYNFKLYSCPARECHGAFMCKGNYIDSFRLEHLEDCMKKCLHDTDCMWFTLEKEHDNCILYEECHDQFDCETCATGEKDCARGYRGNLVVKIGLGPGLEIAL